MKVVVIIFVIVVLVLMVATLVFSILTWDKLKQPNIEEEKNKTVDFPGNVRASAEPHRSKTVAEALVKSLQKELILTHGSLEEEVPEQVMVAMYVEPSSVVLELGSNYGRNTFVIDHILSDFRNLVTVECDPNSHRKLLENFKEQNNKPLQTVCGALSYIPLVQEGWNTYPKSEVKEEDLANFTEVKCVTLSDIERLFSKKFDTLVVDAEGALFYIFKHGTNDFLDSFHTVILENDYVNIEHYYDVKNRLLREGFRVAYSERGGWPAPCAAFFFQVFIRI
jgi:FkbM family methyltransferase